MTDPDPQRIRRRIDQLDLRIARVELQVATITGAACDLQRAGLFETASTEQLVASLWMMVDRLKVLRDSWAELLACLVAPGSDAAVAPLLPQDRPLLH